jgi:hypothetical protein
MNVVVEEKAATAAPIWFDPKSGELHAVIAGIDRAIPPGSIADDDFESSSPVAGFSLGAGGAAMVCRYTDGTETLLLADMWLPGGF